MVLQHLTQGKIGWISTGRFVTPIFFLSVARKQMALLKCFWLGKNKSRREIFTIFTYLKPSHLYPQAESNLSGHPDRNKPLLLRRHVLIYMLHSWLEAFHQETHIQLISLPKLVWNRKRSSFTLPALASRRCTLGANTSVLDLLRWWFGGLCGLFVWVFFCGRLYIHAHIYMYICS